MAYGPTEADREPVTLQATLPRWVMVFALECLQEVAQEKSYYFLSEGPALTQLWEQLNASMPKEAQMMAEQCESPKVLVSEALLKIAREAILLEANTCRHSQAGRREFWEQRARMLEVVAQEITELIREAQADA